MSEKNVQDPEEDTLEFDTAFEFLLVKKAVTQGLEKFKEQPLTEYRDQRMSAYRKQIREIDNWMKGQDTLAPQLDATIIEEIDIEELLGKRLIINRRDEKLNKDHKVEPAALPSGKNFFQPDGDGLKIGFQGREATFHRITRPLKTLGELLRYPNQLKEFISTVEFDENTNSSSSSIQIDLPPIARRNSQNVNKMLTPELIFALNEKALDLFDRMKANPCLTDNEDLIKETVVREKEFEELKEWLRKAYNANLKDDGTIVWGRLLDKNLVSKQKNANWKSIIAGIRFLANSGMPELAAHLNKYLLPEKKYCPPDGTEQFDITI